MPKATARVQNHPCLTLSSCPLQKWSFVTCRRLSALKHIPKGSHGPGNSRRTAAMCGALGGRGLHSGQKVGALGQGCLSVSPHSGFPTSTVGSFLASRELHFTCSQRDIIMYLLRRIFRGLKSCYVQIRGISVKNHTWYGPCATGLCGHNEGSREKAFLV